MSAPLKFWFNPDVTLAIPGAFIATHSLKSPDTVLREKLLDYVATPPLVGIILDYVAPTLPVRDFGDAPFDRLECPGPPFRLENARTAVTERDALVCAEIARLLTIQESVSKDTSTTMRPHPHVVGVETSWALDVPKMLIADYNGAMIRGLVARPVEHNKAAYVFIPGHDWGSVIAAGRLVAKHCHPYGIIVRDFSPDRFIPYYGEFCVNMAFATLSQPYMRLSKADAERHEYDDDMKYYSAWESILETDASCENKVAVTSASDVYAFGLLLFTAVMGRYPWQLCTPRKMVQITRVMSKTKPGAVPISPFGSLNDSHIPAGSSSMCLLIDSCLSPPPQDRPGMAEVLEAFVIYEARQNMPPGSAWRLHATDSRWRARHKQLEKRWFEFMTNSMGVADEDC